MPKRKNSSGDSARVKRPRVDSAEIQSSAHNLQSAALQVVASRQKEQSQLSSHPQSKGIMKGATTIKAKATQPQKATIQSQKATITPQKATIKTTSKSSCSGEIIHKLAPPRPFATVPSSTSANGPKSSHKEGQNLICITRHTPLAAYLSRCKKLLVDDGCQLLHLHAMGAAIPHLLTLSVSLPPILPFARNEIKVEVRTGTIEVMDEIIPEDEDEDMSLRSRNKGGLSVMIQIRDGKGCTPSVSKNNKPAKRIGAKSKQPKVLVIPEQDQEDEMEQDEDESEPDD